MHTVIYGMYIRFRPTLHISQSVYLAGIKEHGTSMATTMNDGY